MKNFISEADIITVPSPKEIHSGEIVVIGLLAGVSLVSCKEKEPLSISTQGVFSLPKKKDEAFSIGDKAYIKEGVITNKPEGATDFGLCVSASDQNSERVDVRIH